MEVTHPNEEMRKRKRIDQIEYDTNPKNKTRKVVPSISLLDVVLEITKDNWVNKNDILNQINIKIETGEFFKPKKMEESLGLLLGELVDKKYLKQQGHSRRASYQFNENEVIESGLEFPIVLDNLDNNGIMVDKLTLSTQPVKKSSPISSVDTLNTQKKSKKEKTKKKTKKKGKGKSKLELEEDGTPLWQIVLEILRDGERDMASREIIEAIMDRVEKGQLPKFKHLRKDVSSRLTQLVKRNQVVRKGKRGSFKFKYLSMVPNKKQVKKKKKKIKLKKDEVSEDEDNFGEVDIEEDYDESIEDLDEEEKEEDFTKPKIVEQPDSKDIDEAIDSWEEQKLENDKIEKARKKPNKTLPPVTGKRNERSLSSIILDVLSESTIELTSSEIVKKITEAIERGKYFPIKHLSDSVSSQLTELTKKGKVNRSGKRRHYKFSARKFSQEELAQMEEEEKKRKERRNKNSTSKKKPKQIASKTQKKKKKRSYKTIPKEVFNERTTRSASKKKPSNFFSTSQKMPTRSQSRKRTREKKKNQIKYVQPPKGYESPQHARYNPTEHRNDSEISRRIVSPSWPPKEFLFPDIKSPEVFLEQIDTTEIVDNDITALSEISQDFVDNLNGSTFTLIDLCHHIHNKSDNGEIPRFDYLTRKLGLVMRKLRNNGIIVEEVHDGKGPSVFRRETETEGVVST